MYNFKQLVESTLSEARKIDWRPWLRSLEKMDKTKRLDAIDEFYSKFGQEGIDTIKKESKKDRAYSDLSKQFNKWINTWNKAK